MANCRNCLNYRDRSGKPFGTLQEYGWPCAKGVASLDDYIEPHPGSTTVVVQPRLPWVIDDHDCIDFEEE